MDPNDMDGHQVGNGLGAGQPNTGMAPNTGASPNVGQAFSAEQPNTFAPSTSNAYNAPQAPIISSSPDSEDKKESSITRAFGGRSRASKIAAQAPVQPSPLRQNAPEFFQQGMQQQDVAFNMAAEQKAKSKKGLLIGGIIGVGLLIIVTIVTAVTLTAKPSATEPKQIVLSTLNESDVSKINNFESSILHIYNGEINSNDIFTKEFKIAVEDGVNAYHKIYNGLTTNSDYLSKHASKDKIDTIIQKMSTNIKQYEAAKDNYLIIYDAFTNSDSSKLGKISDSRVKEYATNLYSSIAEMKEINAAYDNIDCKNAKILNPATGYDECDELDDRYETASDTIKKSGLAKSIFFGNEPEKTKSNIVKDAINDIYVESKEAGKTNEEKN